METDKKPILVVEGFAEDTADRLPPPQNPAKRVADAAKENLVRKSPVG